MISKVSDVVEEKGLTCTGWQRDLLWFVRAGDVDEENSRARLRLFIDRLVIANRDAN
jgi:hypothetical protein